MQEPGATPDNRPFGRGFTLIELLVVIAVVAILTAILLPVFARVRENGRKVTCASNMRQLTAAFLMYADDYDEAFPNLNYEHLWGQYWDQLVYPYVKNNGVYQCPSRCTYYYCYALFNTVASINNHRTFAPKQTWTVGMVTYPSQKILLWENPDYHDTNKGEYICARHFSFVDGHVKFLHSSRLEPRHPAVRYDPNWTWDAGAGIDFR